MLDLRLPSGYFFLLLGVILAIYSFLSPGQAAPLTTGNVNLYCGGSMIAFGGCLLLLARRRAS
jgi:hypothetical protein